MNKFKSSDISINDAIVLTKIYKQFYIFRIEYKKLKNKYGNIANILWKIANGNPVFMRNELKEFYYNNKELFDMIKNNTDFSLFLIKFFENNWYDKYCYYMLEHDKDIDKIKILLNKIKEMGITTLCLDEDIDFTKDIYDVDDFTGFSMVNYFENMEFIPSYYSVKYRAKDSNYMISFPYRIPYELDLFGSKITVSNLLFDSSRLPEKNNREAWFNVILDGAKKCNDSVNKIREIVDLDVALEDFETKFLHISEVVDKLDYVDDKESLKKVLKDLKDKINLLKSLKNKVSDDILREDCSLSSEKLDSEKKEYIKRREWSSIDID